MNTDYTDEIEDELDSLSTEELQFIMKVCEGILEKRGSPVYCTGDDLYDLLESPDEYGIFEHLTERSVLDDLDNPNVLQELQDEEEALEQFERRLHLYHGEE